MMNSLRKAACVFLLLLVLVLSGCSTTPHGPTFSPVQHISPGKALVYFYRPNMFRGGRATFRVYVNDGLIVEMKNGGYYPLIVDPGKLRISTKMKPTFGYVLEAIVTLGETIDIDAEAGVRYFVKVDFTKTKQLQLVPNDVGREEIEQLKLNPGYRESN